MTDPQQEQEQQQMGTFPAPPLFYKDFTPSNITVISSLRASAIQNHSQPQAKTKFDPATSLPPRILDLPPELRCLQPPEPPRDGTYRCFGIDCSLADREVSLQALGITQLYTPPSTPSPDSNTSAKQADRAFILKRLSKSLLLNFLELVGVMGVDAAGYEEKIEDLKTLFVNFHHLLNEYRPHQARESLILMMRESLERSQSETEGILRMKSQVEDQLIGLAAANLEESEGAKKEDKGDYSEDEDRDVWEEIWRTFG